MFASHRLAFRIARREALRYKGRSALSIALLGIPLLGVAIGASAYDTAELSEEETAEQYLGENEAYIEFAAPGVPIQQYEWGVQWPIYEADAEEPGRAVVDGEILEVLPIGTRITPYTPDFATDQVSAETPDGIGQIDVYGYNLADGAYEAAGLEYLEGSMPGRGEVVLSEAAAEYLEIGVGDEFVVDKGVGTDEHEVSGIVELPWNLGGRFAIGSVFAASATGWLVDTPEPLTHEEALALNELGLTVWATAMVDDPPPTPEPPYSESMTVIDDATFTIYGLIVAVVIMEVVLLAGPAFAISARRRSREFALMSATGATPAQIRGTVLAGGVLFGLIAAVVAVLLGIGIVAATLPLLEERVVGHRSAGLRIMPWLQAALVGVAIATGLLSALAAAVSASRINVVAALMGRTPRHKGSKRWLVVGLATVGLGVASGLVGVSGNVLPLMAAAIVLAQLGLVACTPALLALTARLGRWLPLAPRMALREAGRNRGSAAPAIAAVLGVVAGGVVFSMVVTADAVRQEEQQERVLPQDTLLLSLSSYGSDSETPDWETALAEVEPMLQTRLDDLELVPVTQYSGWNGCTTAEASGAGTDTGTECTWTVTRPEANQCSYWDADLGTDESTRAAVEAAREDPRCDENPDAVHAAWGDFLGSTDPTVVAAHTDLEGAELDAAVRHLESGGVLVADRWAITEDGTVVLEQYVTELTADGAYGETQTMLVELPAMAVDDDRLGMAGLFLSPGAAERMGVGISPWWQEYLVQTTSEVDDGVVEAIAEDLNREVAGGTVWARFERVDYTDPTMFYIVLMVTGLCALIALGATAVSTGLIIAEQRRDMSTLGAVGAAPGLRKRFAMWQTVMIALFGAGLGTVAGILGYALIRAALNRPLQFTYPFETLYGWELPWAAIGITVLAVPLIAAVGALVFTRAKLPSERRLT